MNNSVYGEDHGEHPRNRVDDQLLNDEKKAQKRKEYGDKAELSSRIRIHLGLMRWKLRIFMRITTSPYGHITAILSDYPRDHFYSVSPIQRRFGCFKDELHSKRIFEFIASTENVFLSNLERGEKKTAKEYRLSLREM
ncbi:hypothetical protein AVEN_158169-1 [Araneus ventricosus]|uniref:Uncharacterized protein n=1 Tax=Araneus ventricosus TaxID=182803 RepID=A0A4Y2G751_ARAVE|nr:hypothetical protein AVEN_158169-1 [Araneus ventricosus]